MAPRRPAADSLPTGVRVGALLVALTAAALWLPAGSGAPASPGGGAGAAAALPAGPGAPAPAPAPLAAPTVRSASVSVVSQEFTDAEGRVVSTDRLLTIDGSGFFGTSFGPFVRFRRADGREVEAPLVILQGGDRILASPPRGTYGPATLVVENPDGGSASLDVSL